MSNKKIALIGLGYVGLPLAVEFGKKRSVIGFDINQPRINELKNGVDSTLETTNEELKGAIHLTYTANLEDIKDCTIFIVTVPTPIDKNKRPDLTPLKCWFVHSDIGLNGLSLNLGSPAYSNSPFSP